VRVRIILITAILLIVCLGLFVWRPAQPKLSAEALGISPKETNSHQLLADRYELSSESTSQSLTSRFRAHGESGSSNRFSQQAHSASSEGLAAWKQRFVKPIAFSGIAVDQDAQAVEGATVFLTVNQIVRPETSVNTNLLTDARGMFSITGIEGSTLGVRVEKAGYYPARKQNQEFFDYTDASETGSFVPDLGRPLVFQLRRKGNGVDLITSQHGVSPELQISGLGNGTITRVDFLTRQTGGEGQLELSTQRPVQGELAKEWSLRMSVPSGGLIEQHDEFPFMAPESGYSSSIEFYFKKGETNWTEVLRKDFYVVFDQPPKYGRLSVTAGVSRGVSLRYAINPDGSRNLEPKEYVVPRRELPPGGVEVVPSH